MNKRGSTTFYVGLIVFIVAFVAAVGTLNVGTGSGMPGITARAGYEEPSAQPVVALTGYVVREELEAAKRIKLPQTPDADEVQIAKEESLPEKTVRVLITPFDSATAEDIKRQVMMRHLFGEQFTADVTEEQIPTLKRLGDVEFIPLYEIAARKGGRESAVRTLFPSDQTPWNMEMIYQDPSLTNTLGGSGVTVAVLDTGMYQHFDLKNRMKQCKDFTKGPTIKNSCSDGNGHGTHVAGVIAADAGTDRKGIYGVAPEVNLFAYRVCDNNGFCWTDDIAVAIRYAADQGANIISMSISGDTESNLIKDAVSYATGKGVLVVAAAGNDGPDYGSIDWPAANPQVVAVGAIDSNKIIASFSSRGVNDGDYIVEEREIEFGMPGVSIESTWPNNEYRKLSGTSMATPHLSGLAAKLWTGNAETTRNHLQGIARRHDLDQPGDDPATGYGLAVVE